MRYRSNRRPTTRRTLSPTFEPVTLDEATEHLTGYNPADNDYIVGLITVARESFESETGLALHEQTWELTLPGFPREIVIGRPPLRDVLAVTYYDGTGTLQTLPATEYRISPQNHRSVMTEAYGKSWPSTELDRPDAVKVEFTAGIYTSDGSEPETIDPATLSDLERFYPLAQQAIKILVDHIYRNRGAVAPVELYVTPYAYQHLVNLCKVSWM